MLRWCGAGAESGPACRSASQPKLLETAIQADQNLRECPDGRSLPEIQEMDFYFSTKSPRLPDAHDKQDKKPSYGRFETTLPSDASLP